MVVEQQGRQRRQFHRPLIGAAVETAERLLGADIEAFLEIRRGAGLERLAAEGLVSAIGGGQRLGDRLLGLVRQVEQGPRAIEHLRHDRFGHAVPDHVEEAPILAGGGDLAGDRRPARAIRRDQRRNVDQRQSAPRLGGSGDWAEQLAHRGY